MEEKDIDIKHLRMLLLIMEIKSYPYRSNIFVCALK